MPRNLVKPEKRIQARRQLEEMIREQSLWGQRLMGERELAAELGVGRKTVRGALAELEGDGLIERRQGAGTFVAGRPGGARRRRSARLAVIAAEHFEQASGWHYKGEMVRALLGHAPRMRTECAVLAFDRPEEAKLIRDARYMRSFNGFVTVAEDAPDLLAHLLGLKRGPVVMLDHSIRDMPIVGVVDGSFEGARAVTKHLLALGHRRIGFLDSSNRPANPWKYNGYRAALAERRVPYDDALVAVPARPGNPARPYGDLFRRQMRDFAEEAVEHLLSLPEPPTAILGFDDHRALPALRALERRGCRVGEDFSLAGLGDSAYRRGLCDRLTNCRIYPRKMGRAALRAALQTERLDEGRTIIIPNRLIIRSSTCLPRGVKGGK